MFYTNNVNAISELHLVAENGYSGLWLFRTDFLYAGFLPVMFAPLWSRLRFITDNQFILYRFSGIGAKILHAFRAFYVGYLVTAFVLSFIIVVMIKMLKVFFQVNETQVFFLLLIFILLVVVKNAFSLKVKTDFINGLLYISIIIIAAFFIVKSSGGINKVYYSLNHEYRSVIRLFPSIHNTGDVETIPGILVFFLIHWWSVNVLDGAGPEAQRYMNVKDSKAAFKSAFLPVFVMGFVFIFSSIILDTGIYNILQNPEMIPVSNKGNNDFETFYFVLFDTYLPEGLKGITFVAFMAAFTTSFEAILNWGTSFVTVDLIQTYSRKKIQNKNMVFTSYLLMVIIGVTSLLIAWYNQNLLGLQKFLFSMGAGVGSVFILRWFWWRINAWSQLAAMIGSLVSTILYDFLFNNWIGFKQVIEKLQEYFNFNFYPLKILLLTVFVTGLWLLVTFLTPPDKEEHLRRFFEKVKPFGRWSKITGEKNLFPIRKVVFLGIFSMISLFPLIIIWLMKFGSLIFGIVLMMCWIGLLWFTYKYMKKIIDN